MKLILAQGNPGRQYSHTRHNVGWQIIDAIAKSHKVKWRNDKKIGADIAEFTVKRQKIILVKPTLFYNETGRAARALVDFYKLHPKHDVLVIHDDLALPLGTIRVREKGSDAGNNGVKSLNSHLGEYYWRLRIGIWNELKDSIPDSAFVLSKFSKSEQKQLDTTLIPHTLILVDQFIDGMLEAHSVSP